MTGMLQMRRSRGALSGFLLVLLGLWGALIPRPPHRSGGRDRDRPVADRAG